MVEDVVALPSKPRTVGCRDTGWTHLLIHPTFTAKGIFIIWYRSLRICLRVSLVPIKWLFSLPNDISSLYPLVSWVINQLGKEYSDVLLVSTLNSALLLRIRALFLVSFPGLAEKDRGYSPYCRWGSEHWRSFQKMLITSVMTCHGRVYSALNS